jgi:hypothetical protein
MRNSDASASISPRTTSLDFYKTIKINTHSIVSHWDLLWPEILAASARRPAFIVAHYPRLFIGRVICVAGWALDLGVAAEFFGSSTEAETARGIVSVGGTQGYIIQSKTHTRCSKRSMDMSLP